MRDVALTLLLSPFQVARLIHFCRLYRAYAWQALPPSTERNQTMRAVQAVQGRLVEGNHLTASEEACAFPVNGEEQQALRHLIRTLLSASEAEPPSSARQQRRAELGQLCLWLEQQVRQAQAS